MIIACIYVLIFSVIIHVAPFFENNVFGYKKFKALNAVFLLKVSCGFFLTWIYTSYYPDRQSADIFKYYDDAKIMFSAYEQGRYEDFFRMVFGFSNDSPYFDTNYYNHMNHWYRHYDFGTYNDNHTIIRFNALAMVISFGSFHAHTVFMCFISFWGLTALYKAFKEFLPNKEKVLFVSVFLLPSVLFWASGVLKEGILLFALGFLLHSFFNLIIHRQRILSNLIMLGFSVCLLIINKQYLLVAAVPALGCFLMVHVLNFKKPFLFYLGIYLMAAFGVYGYTAKFSEENILQTLSLKQRDFIAVSKGGVFIQNEKIFVRIAPDKKEFLDTLSKNTFRIKPGSSYMYWKNESLNDTLYAGNSIDTASYKLIWDLPLAGSTINIPKLEPTLASVFKTAPRALFNALAKPGLLSAKSFLERISAVENALILLFLIVCTLLCRTGMNKNLFALCFFLSITILFLIGYTTPVAGAIVRYKVPILPFIMLCGIVIFDTNKLKFLADKPKDPS